MLLGRRKSGFTEEVSLRPSEIPDYVNEENDTTFRRPESSCLGDMQQEASEPQEWVPPPPMPMYRLLRRKGVETQLHIYGTKEQKDIGHVFHVNCKLPLAAQCNDDQCAFFRSHIR